jgi:hypothetical protein
MSRCIQALHAINLPCLGKQYTTHSVLTKYNLTLQEVLLHEFKSKVTGNKTDTMTEQGECRKKCKKRTLTPTSLLHIISLDSNICFIAGVARIYTFFFKFCSFRYETATSVGRTTSS